MRRNREDLVADVQAAAKQQAGLSEVPAPLEPEPEPNGTAPELPSAVKALLDQRPRRQLEVCGLTVELTDDQLARGPVCTTVYLPVELREAVRQAERRVGVNYQEFVRIAVSQLLEQVSASGT